MEKIESNSLNICNTIKNCLYTVDGNVLCGLGMDGAAVILATRRLKTPMMNANESTEIQASLNRDMISAYDVSSISRDANKIRASSWEGSTYI